MSPLRLVLIASAAANAVLAGALLLRQPSGPPATTAASPIANDQPEPASTVSAPEAVSWEHLEGLDHAAFVAAVRRQGWSRDVLCAIVAARLDLAYAPEVAALRARHRPDYWRGNRNGDIGEQFNAETRTDLNRIFRARQETLKALLGPDADEPHLAAYHQRRYGPIPSEKVSALETIEADYRELIAQARDRAHGVMLDEDREVIRLLERERDADIAALLTPEEREAYDLRASRTAQHLRYRLQAFNPSEEEYIAIFRLQKAFEEQHGGSSPTREQWQQRQEAQAELNRQIAAAIGEERFQEYDLKAHPTWSQAADWVRQQQLPANTIEPLARLARDMQERLTDIGRDRTLSAQERSARRAALNREARLRLGQILPADQAARYESGPGSWLRSLQPRTR